ncbi:MAG: hypothetical protein ACJ76N_19050 [Thermoanaerobaculia bacterium]
MKRALALSLFFLALPLLTAAAAEVPTAAPATLESVCLSTPSTAAPPQSDLPSVGIPKPRQVSLCTDTCISDFKICRDSCHSLTCYNQCRSAYDNCVADC